ncbi:hypothetical protein [Treponema pallidum]|uniref:Uncharacterized protein TP_0375 n=2 Tax=Treponema pallidum subsp. pallidum TaxID=161 RepID=Y375_TREPA|nr:hypothetical protein [Treponema pallidum]O83390.1 RecName: Full=Uncharacterized protein TP_0375 [Treponema pallidum subsp. pallidum str. Nichols]AAC65380.1 predicted coding region TP0375 [Treponema pallidum subsp. pallidum str. Nichols]ACD70801.1 hypothetical protein TPASS_0375 [Treponema pallidum subsp. pallidum SS14]ADD72501.1 conserved hypothetical protein [Treponema pallidum subsp. pallidum str. Chicago]AFU66383.1 hypothetical protein TPAMA_0375 [Treponema pallidum subsp. pallidum str. 
MASVFSFLLMSAAGFPTLSTDSSIRSSRNALTLLRWICEAVSAAVPVSRPSANCVTYKAVISKFIARIA